MSDNNLLLVDLRSDTVSTPTRKMRDAMRDAPVGDDVIGDDPTVKRLEERAAELFGKEAALFTGSGTMSNQVAVLCLCRRGDQVILHNRSHMFNLEVAGLASIGQVQARTIYAPSGYFDLAELEAQMREAQIQSAPTTLVCLENSFDLNRGLAVSKEHMDEVAGLARSRRHRVYLDGARIFNTAITLRTTVAALSEQMDAVAVCLSKGLACPIGSMLCGPKDFIDEARRMRQMLGGGWRQAGIVAAAGLVAFDEMIERLTEDHENARLLAQGLLKLGFLIDLGQVQTNIIHIGLASFGLRAVDFCSALNGQGVKAKPIGQAEVRMITHKDLTAAMIPRVLEAVKNTLLTFKR